MAVFVAANSSAVFSLPALFLAWPAHFAILGAVVLLGAILAVLQRTWFRDLRGLRVGIGAVLLIDMLAWYSYQAWMRQLTFPGHLPLELCDVTLVLTIVVLFTLSAVVFDVCYYFALAGTSMALLTPDLWERFPSLATGQFFFAHGLVVSAVLYLAWSGLARPRPGSVGKAMLAVNIWAVVAGSFDWLFGTNYMYLRHRPQNASLLSFLGPWPWYIAGGQVVALILFLLLYWPFWRRARELERNCG